MSKIDPNDLSFNELPEDIAINYLMEHGHFHDPFNLPDGVIMINPYTGKAMRHNKGGEPTHNPPELNGERILRNPFTSKSTGKILYENGVAIKKWGVSEDNKWVKGELDKDGI